MFNKIMMMPKWVTIILGLLDLTISCFGLVYMFKLIFC